MVSISKSIFEPCFLMVSDGFLMDFDEKRNRNLHDFNNVWIMLVDVVFSTLFWWFSVAFSMHFLYWFPKAWFWILALIGNCEIAVFYVNNSVFYGFSKFMIFCNRIEKHDFRNRFRFENWTENNVFLLRILIWKSLKISWKIEKICCQNCVKNRGGI